MSRKKRLPLSPRIALANAQTAVEQAVDAATIARSAVNRLIAPWEHVDGPADHAMHELATAIEWLRSAQNTLEALAREHESA